MISLPSTPFHRPIGNGIGRPHVSFWVENETSPECAAIDGKEKPNPKQSGRYTSCGSLPLNSCRKNRCAYSACRKRDSGDGMLTSTASIQEPASRHRPDAT